jgi:hypothetical protein
MSKMIRSSFLIQLVYPRAIGGTATETGTFISGFIDAGSNRETLTLTRRLLKRLMQSG